MGELRDAIARALCKQEHLGVDRWDDVHDGRRATYYRRADDAIAALRDTLSSEPECITELGWVEPPTYDTLGPVWRPARSYDKPSRASIERMLAGRPAPPTQVEREAQ